MESIEQQSVSASPMRGQVLKKIYRVWFFRRFLPAVLIEIAVFSAFLYFLARAVFVQKIVDQFRVEEIRNMFEGANNLNEFYTILKQELDKRGIAIRPRLRKEMDDFLAKPFPRPNSPTPDAATSK